MHMRNTVPGEDWSMVYFETLAGKRFHVIKLAIDPATEAKLVKELKPLVEKFLALNNGK